VTISLTTEERAWLDTRAQLLGVSRSAYLREVLRRDQRRVAAQERREHLWRTREEDSP
jgi:hypothetical protein